MHSPSSLCLVLWVSNRLCKHSFFLFFSLFMVCLSTPNHFNYTGKVLCSRRVPLPRVVTLSVVSLALTNKTKWVDTILLHWTLVALVTGSGLDLFIESLTSFPSLWSLPILVCQIQASLLRMTVISLTSTWLSSLDFKLSVPSGLSFWRLPLFNFPHGIILSPVHVNVSFYNFGQTNGEAIKTSSPDNHMSDSTFGSHLTSLLASHLRAVLRLISIPVICSHTLDHIHVNTTIMLWHTVMIILHSSFSWKETYKQACWTISNPFLGLESDMTDVFLSSTSRTSHATETVFNSFWLSWPVDFQTPW